MKKYESILSLKNYGDYRRGLSFDEIKYYLKSRAMNTKNSKFKNWTPSELITKFNKFAGVNTVCLGPNNITLMYRHDVERFADLMFDNKSTPFD